MHVGGFPGASRPFQGPPGAYMGLQGALGPPPQKIRFERKMRPAAYCQILEPWAKLKFHAGWSGWTRPPTMAGGGGGVGVAGKDLNALRLDAALGPNF